jgi:hypothetical protein
MEGTRVASTSPTMPYAMVFGPSPGISMPVSLMIGGRQVIDHTGQCPTERGVGLAAYPALCVYAATDGGPTRDTPDAQATSAELDVDIAGPSLVRIGAYFDIKYQCNGSHRASGETFFTLLPNGRMFRHDLFEVVDPTDALSDAAGPCNDVSESDIFATSFFSVTTPPERLLGTDDNQVFDTDQNAMCATWSAGEGGPDPLVLGVHWFDAGNKRPSANGISALIFDLSTGPSVGSTPLHLEQEMRLVPGATSCSAVTTAMLKPDPQLLLDGIALEFHEGLYVDQPAHPAGFTLSAPTNGGIAEGFGVSVDVGGADHLALTRAGSSTTLGNVTFTPDDAETPDDPSDDRLVIWFDDGLAGGDTITVEPRS